MADSNSLCQHRRTREEIERCRSGDHALCAPDLPRHGACSECGGSVQVTRSSAPPERRRCRACQQARPRSVGPRRSCKQCGKDFQPGPKASYRPPQEFCSKSCAASVPRVARRRPASAGKRKSPGWAELSEASRQRRRQRARAKRLSQSATSDGVTDEAILERDRWMCGICGKRIGKTFKYPHPRSKSIDHVVPQSQGGDDTAANKRAAHLGCNLSRGNRGGGEQLALVG